MIIARVGKQTKLECDENDFDDLNDELVGESAMRKLIFFLLI